MSQPVETITTRSSLAISADDSDVSLPSADPNASLLPKPIAEGNDSIQAVATDIETFARGWIGRIRRLIHRSSQLVERESVLASANAKLDQQKAEWSKRTAAKDEALRDQAKKLTAAWLDVEAERRKAIQGAKAAASAAVPQASKPLLATPVATPDPTRCDSRSQLPAAVVPVPVAATPLVATPAAATPSPFDGNSSGDDGKHPSTNQTEAVGNGPPRTEPASQTNMPQVAPNVHGPQPIPIAPTPVTGVPMSMAPPAMGLPKTMGASAAAQDEPGEMDAASQERVEAFKRMQRTIRTHQNKSN